MVCDTLVKKVAPFCPCPKTLPLAKVKSYGLILLVEKISKQLRIDIVVLILVIVLKKIYEERE